MKKSSLKKNLRYQTAYQILNTCIPLITSPYLARVLGAEKQGVFSYTQSIVNYFTLVAMLGTVNYGTRAIALCNNDKTRYSNTFWNIYVFQVIVSLAAIIAYSLFFPLFCRGFCSIAALQGLYLLGVLINVDWFFFGIEKIKTAVSRGIIIRIISVALILLFVKSNNDLWIYTIILSGSTVISHGILWLFLPREIEFKQIKNVKWKDVQRHIKPNLILFIPILAMSVYHIMDKTMLGLLSSYEQVGYYYNADKVINIPIGVLTGAGTVLLPRMTSMIHNNESTKANKIFHLSIETIIAVSAAMAFGIAAISKEFTPFFFGEGFDPCTILIIVLAPVLIVKGLSSTARMQYLIPNRLENIYIQSVFAGAVVNLIVNLILIGQHGALGAVIGTLVAEIVSCLWQFAKMRRYIMTAKTVLKSLIYVIFGVIMFGIVRMVAVFFNGSFAGILFEVLSGVLVYSGLCLTYWSVTKSPILLALLRK